jgi:FMN reductase
LVIFRDSLSRYHCDKNWKWFGSMPSIVMLAGSPSAPSRSAAILQYVQTMLLAERWTFDTITIRDLDHRALITANFNDPTLVQAKALVAAAAGVILATPVYKAAYSGVLKAFLDILPPNALAGKAVLPIVTGGAAGHQLALDYALKPVLAALGAGVILNGVYLIDAQYEYADGRVIRFVEEEAEKRLRQAALDLASTLQKTQEAT